MAGHRPFSELTRDWSPERRARVDALKEQMEAEMELYQLREQAEISQVDLAKRLKTAQGAVSRLERQTDMLLSTLREYVRAIGGQLEVRAKFKNREIVLSHLGAGRRVGRARNPKRRARHRTAPRHTRP